MIQGRCHLSRSWRSANERRWVKTRKKKQALWIEKKIRNGRKGESLGEKEGDKSAEKREPTSAFNFKLEAEVKSAMKPRFRNPLWP